jgi:phosphohistidine phosphatase SixA
MKTKTKIWIGVGAYFVASASPVIEISNPEIPTQSADISVEIISSAQASEAFRANLLSQGGEGGEGGEGGDTKPAFQDKLSGAQLLNALQKGGYVIFFRHVQTEVDYADQVFARMGYCATQRVLGEEGWQQARKIGQAFRALKIPVSKVYSSEYCRAWQTADLAFGRYEKVPGLNFAPAEEYTEAQVAQMRAGIKPLLVAVPAAGTNTVIVGHDDVFDAATGIYPEPQGVAYILKPDGKGSFEILANIEVDEWAKLAR